jgi:hypothetical protein
VGPRADLDVEKKRLLLLTGIKTPFLGHPANTLLSITLNSISDTKMKIGSEILITELILTNS